MKKTTRALIFTLCLIAELMSAYIFVKYAVMSASKLWMLCAGVIIASVTAQAMVVTE